MRLDEVIADLDVRAVLGAPTDVTAVTHDSRQVTPGALFCCVPGTAVDGHRFAADAVGAGATSLLVDHRLDVAATQVVVDDVRVAMARAAAAFHGNPSRAMDIVGVTGTNGKTTTTWLLRAIFEADGRVAEMIGTLTGPRTTPESTDLQAQLATLRDSGVTALAMEVSSIALSLSRVEGIRFAVGVFTNLSRDHLELHASMEDYFAAKARLFEPERAAVGVINADDPRGRLLLDAAHIPSRSYSLSDVTDLEVGARSSRGTWRGRELVVPIGGAFNV
jgi:UDP-N-acetylmuramoyl-L-alanyl-D-glutamate--2,6-diaminopimelate ligase